MKLGDKWLCKNGMIAHIDRQNEDGGFSATMRNAAGEILYNGSGIGWCASYDKDGKASGYFAAAKKIA